MALAWSAVTGQAGGWRQGRGTGGRGWSVVLEALALGPEGRSDIVEMARAVGASEVLHRGGEPSCEVEVRRDGGTPKPLRIVICEAKVGNGRVHPMQLEPKGLNVYAKGAVILGDVRPLAEPLNGERRRRHGV